MFKLFRLQSRSRHETAVKEQLRCGLLILRLGGQQDPLNMTSLIPPLFYRIGQYQEMYNFICWRLLSDTAPSTAHMYLGDRLAAMRPRRSPILPDMADIFEDISVFGRVQFPPWILLSLCLLKIKMYLELRQFHQITQRLRPSLTNLTVLRDHCQIPEIRNNRRLLDQESFRQLILQRLLDNIRQLIDRIELRDPLVLLQLAMAARKGGPGRWDHMNDLEQKAVGLLHFRMIYQAWAETPRSISALAAIAYSREEDENEELMVPAQ
ncbi:hypothetical protein N7539_004122 [Penicillium diatomitis]|uniref:Uncharacterized protein n=1 Tax=Penicillium diatomitis TaxID=2819901 RepID=A0A9W9XEF7_9EURO|nr:uncharacterized protein N7539_004122 [Penicillium diatomitis]KAJ5489232.1 hypothetical protein N7539_004122 [Penicillium diatomitis]